MLISYREALQYALRDELRADKNVVLFGEDITTNLYGYSEGFIEEFGPQRIIDMPLSEASIVGLAVGAAMKGLRPVIDLTLPNFMYIAMDQIVNNLAKMQYMYDGSYKMPVTIFCSIMSGGGNAAQHSDRIHSMLSGISGLKVICPAFSQDVYSEMRKAIRDDNPVICFTDRSLFWRETEVNICLDKEDYCSSRFIRRGDDVTVVSISACAQMCEDAYEELVQNNISMEHINLLQISPLKCDDIISSVKKTGRLVICDTSNRTGSIAGEIASRVIHEGMDYLHKPIEIIAGEDVPVPFSKELEKKVLIDKDKIVSRIIDFMKG